MIYNNFDKRIEILDSIIEENFICINAVSVVCESCGVILEGEKFDTFINKLKDLISNVISKIKEIKDWIINKASSFVQKIKEKLSKVNLKKKLEDAKKNATNNSNESTTYISEAQFNFDEINDFLNSETDRGLLSLTNMRLLMKGYLNYVSDYEQYYLSGDSISDTLTKPDDEIEMGFISSTNMSLYKYLSVEGEINMYRGSDKSSFHQFMLNETKHMTYEQFIANQDNYDLIFNKFDFKSINEKVSKNFDKVLGSLAKIEYTLKSKIKAENLQDLAKNKNKLTTVTDAIKGYSQTSEEIQTVYNQILMQFNNYAYIVAEANKFLSKK